MKFLSFSFILTLILGVYVIHSIWTLAQLFIPPKCGKGDRCITSYLSSKPVQNLVLFVSVGERDSNIQKVYTSLDFKYEESSDFEINIKLPQRTRNNGTLYMHAVLLDSNKLYEDLSTIRNTEAVQTFPIVIFTEPQAETFSLLNHQDENRKKAPKYVQPYAHLMHKIPLSILTDDLKLPMNNVPQELYPYIRLRGSKFLPILHQNVLKTRMINYKIINSTMRSETVSVSVSPISFGSMRLSVHIKLATAHLKSMGFTEKDVDDVKGIFVDTNLYLLSLTVLIASCHLLFDFLAFKNDVSFWHKKQSLAGLSGRTVLWRAFSQLVIFFYLLDENTSLLVLIPSGISSLIELWKTTKVLHIRVSFSNWRLRVWRDSASDASEQTTAKADAEAMRYLSMLLYPLCVAGAIYSLIYEPHKGWYSWILHSVVNGVYAFGFLFMLPQLFVNYRLKSVAALPWRAFMYKAFNTFIDDVFAFIITMPMAHRVACFRDDLVFLVYLYQRWLYPVDKSRFDSGASMEDSQVVEPSKEEKKTK